MISERTRQLQQAAADFIKPYEAISDQFLKELRNNEPSDLFVVAGGIAITAHVAGAVLAFRQCV